MVTPGSFMPAVGMLNSPSPSENPRIVVTFRLHVHGLFTNELPLGRSWVFLTPTHRCVVWNVFCSVEPTTELYLAAYLR